MNSNLSGDNRFRAETPDALLATQMPAVRTTLRGIADLICVNARLDLSAMPESRSHLESTERPHQVFLIDGSRGSGKTFTLLTIEYVLQQMSDLCRSRHPVVSEWQKRLEERQWLEPRVMSDLRTLARSRDTLAHTLRIIFPGDMEDGDAVMEAIFASMTTATKLAMKDAEKNRAKEGEELNEELRKGVAQGWYFARRFGYDAIVRDSSDYDDLVVLFERESRKAAGRISAWRDYIDRYLKFHGSAMLVVLLDDSDVRSELTSNILHAIRMYLDHPRIVTVLAGNLKAMRISLLHLKMSALGSAVTALNSNGHPTAREWRRHERKEIEDYLEKILPPEQRIRVKRPQLLRRTDMRGQVEPRSDFEAVVRESLATVCTRVMVLQRGPFLDAKFRLAIARELGRSDVASPHDKTNLEYFLSWWLFSARYRDELQPRSVRQLKTWKVFYEDAVGKHTGADGDKNIRPGHTKRLPVMLFDNPANFTLIHRMSDEDERMAEWLRRQGLEASWVGRRRFRINDSDVDEGSYTYDYVKYRLDLGIAMPVRDNTDEIVSDVMLPSLIGRSFMRRFFQPRQMPRRHRPLGLVRWLNHAAIPANCVYFSDLSKLPDISFVDGLFQEGSPRDQIEKLQSGAWEANLCEKWMELIEDRQERPEDEHLLRYLREIVFEGLRETKDASSDELIMALDPPDLFLKRQYAVYEHFLDDEWANLRTDVHTRWATYREAFAFLKGKTPDRSVEGFDKRRPDIRWPRMLALYAALTTDLRRAWHAIRIHQASPTLLDGSDGSTRQPFEHNSSSAIANRDLMPLPSLQFVEAVLKASDWTRALMTIFSRKNVRKVLEEQNTEDTRRLVKDCNLLFTPEITKDGGLIDLKTPQRDEEERDFKLWTTTLRRLCRTACNGWPVNDGVPSEQIEEKFFAGDFEVWPAEGFMLKIFSDKNEPAQTASDLVASQKANEKLRNGRAGRSLVWLLWGLAPSLPAIIHANVMSLVYQAELELHAAEDYGAEKGKKLREDAGTHYRNALNHAKEWASLVGTLAVIVRYIKIKCLHLDTALFLDRMLRETPEAKQGAAISERESKAQADIGRFLEKCGYDLNERSHQTAGGESLNAMRIIYKEFWSPRANLTLADTLAIHPDVAPSSLFGDDWMTDLFQRSSVKARFKSTGIKPPLEDRPDNPLSVNGIFGEVEQWLWASSRSIRKLHERVEENKKKLQKDRKLDADPVESEVSDKPSPARIRRAGQRKRR